jgi:hypothetical protein
VAVHTNIPHTLVARATVDLEGNLPVRPQADACGNFVGFFDEGAIKTSLLKLGRSGMFEVTLTLTGETLVGNAFAGTDPTVQIMP